jgi:Multiubiquitin
MNTTASVKEQPQTGPDVTITVDNKPFTIHRGSHTVRELKQLAGVSAGYELEQIVDGTLIPLKDEQRIAIKGGERFVSHPPAGAAS